MEKIQSAIAKARAARSGAAVAMPRPAAAAPPMASVGTLAPGAAAVPGHDPAAVLAGASDVQSAVRVAAPPPAPVPAVPLAAQAAANRTDDLRAAWHRLEEIKPQERLMQRHRVVSFAGGRDAVPIDVMRTKLLQQMRANNWRRLAITSPNSGCGKSTTCLNLAFSLARQPDIRTVVAELDLRRPSLAKTLGIRQPHMFSKVLDGSADFAAHAVRYGQNVAFATNHGPARNPAELLQNPHIGAALSAIESQFDPTILIFDMPPMLVSDDTMAFVGQVDCVLLIAAAESTSIQEVDSCERDLASQTNVLGVVLNKCRYLDRSYGYSYYG